MMMSGSPSPHAVNAITVPSADTAAALTFSVIWIPFLVPMRNLPQRHQG